MTDESSFSLILDPTQFAHMQRVAQLFASGTMIPDHYRNNIGNCFIALQMAVRLGVDPFMFMQKSYIVHGRPGIEAQLVIALINSSGLFKSSLEYEIQGDDPNEGAHHITFRCRAFATRKDTGKQVNGPWIDWKMVDAEGWNKPRGESKMPSKWTTLPEMMFRYRAATYFGRLYCPERLMGMLTGDELDDVKAEPGEPQAPADPKKNMAQVLGMAAAEDQTAPAPQTVTVSTATASAPAPTTAPAAPAPTPTAAPQAEQPAKPGRKSGRPAAKPAEDPKPEAKPEAPAPAPAPEPDPKLVEVAGDWANSFKSVSQAVAWIIDRKVANGKPVEEMLAMEPEADPRKITDLERARDAVFHVALRLLTDGLWKPAAMGK